MEDKTAYKSIKQLNQWQNLGIGKIPPQAVDVEEAVLGAILCEKRAFNEANILINADVFYKQAHANIYNSCKRLFEKNEPIDLLTVKNDLIKSGEIDICGGVTYLAELTQRVNSSANIEHHCYILKEKYAKRQLLEMSFNIQKLAFEDTEDVFETIDFVNDSFTDISESLITNQEKNINAQFIETINNISLAQKNKGVIGVPSKFTDIQNKLKGYRKGNLIILGARPSMGKSLWMLNEAVFQCQADFKVAIFSMEMTATEQLARLISSVTDITTNDIETGNIDGVKMKLIHDAISAFPKRNLTIYEKSKMNVRYIKTCIQSLKRKGMIDIAYIDHLGLIKPERQGNRNNEIGEITSDLKSFAKDIEIPIILLSQLSREATKRSDKKPQLQDLRDSGNIEQDANVCMFLHREEYYLDTQQKIDEYQDSIRNIPNAINMIGKAEISIAKNRGGKLGSAIANFRGEVALMENYYDHYEVTETQAIDFSTNKTLDTVKVPF